jgi:methylmalonyl-CoA mutase cobalamin-binding subunit
VLIGHRHIQGCAERITDLLDESYSVIGISKLNANLETITYSTNLETEKQTREDTTIICGGTIDVESNKSQIGLHHLINLAKKTESMYIVMVDVPNQY